MSTPAQSPAPAATTLPIQPPASFVQPPQDVQVRSASGQTLTVLGQDEEAFYRSQSQRYQQQFVYTNIADLSDLDRLLFLELQNFRLTLWLGRGRDYDGQLVDIASTRRAMKDLSDAISKVKTDLGMTKSQRDKEREQGTGAYLTTLKQRAREFGIHREKQLQKALALTNQLFAIVGAFDRADKVERDKLGFRDESEILDWVRNVMRPEYEVIDEHFRQRPDGQKYWLKEV